MASTGPIANLVPAAAESPSDRSKVKLQSAVRDFEALFVSYMLKSMRGTTSSSDELFGEGFGGDMMDGLFDMELSRQMSKNSSVGIAEMLYRKMTGESLPRSGSTIQAPKAPAGDIAPLAPLPVQPQSTKAEGTTTPASSVTPGAGVPPPAPAGKTTGGSQAEVVPQPPPPASPRHRQDTIGQKLTPYEPAILEAAEKHSLDPDLLRAVIASESGGNAKARSSKNAKGLMQLIDSTAADLGVRNVWDPRENILGGAKYLQQLLNRFGGDVDTALASYNAGPGAVEKHGGIPPFKETKEYVQKVKQYIQHFKQLEGDGNDNE